MTNEDYIASNESVFSDGFLNFAEGATIIACLWLLWEAFRLTKFFAHDDSKLAHLLTWEFLTKAGTAIITLLMGFFLYINYAEGVKYIVVIRPIFICFSAYALHQLYRFYRDGS